MSLMKPAHQRAAQLLTIVHLAFVIAAIQQLPCAQAQPTAPQRGAGSGVVAKYQAILNEYADKLRAAPSDLAVRQAAMTARDQAFAQLLEQHAKTEPAALSLQDAQALTTISSSLRRTEDVARFARVAIDRAGTARVQSHYMTLISSLITLTNYSAAAAAFDEGVKKYPELGSGTSHRFTFYSAFTRSGEHSAAGQQAMGFVVEHKTLVDRDPTVSRQLARYVEMMVEALKKANQPDEAKANLETLISLFNDPRLEGFRTQLLARELALMSTTGQGEPARARLATELETAERALASDPSSTNLALRKAILLHARAEIETDAAKKAAQLDEALTYISGQLRPESAALELIDGYSELVVERLQELLAKGADTAKTVEAANQLLDSLAPKTATGRSAVAQAKSLVRSAAAPIASGGGPGQPPAVAHTELMGKPFLSLDADVVAWVNGAPIKSADLAGKVVLLDFWAVWCGPCIATFPHLRDWQKKYEAKGLVILGLTTYYGYDWDAEAARIKPVSNLSEQREQAALVQFANHYQLNHRFGVMSKTGALASSYGVTGIPQAVLIDKQGKIRMIKVGSGEENAKALEGMIEELLK